MDKSTRDKIYGIVLYGATGVLILLGIAILLFELISPRLVEKAYNQELSPTLNNVITDPSFPLWHFKWIAGSQFYGIVSLTFFLVLLATLVALAYQNGRRLRRAVAPVAEFAKKLLPVYQWTTLIYQWTILTILVLMLASQIIDENRSTFPFTSWKMYGSTSLPDEIVYHEFKGRTIDGEEVRLNPARLYSSAKRPIYWGLKSRGEAIAKSSEAADSAVYNQILRSIGTQYERLHGKRLDSVRVLRGSVFPIQSDSSWHRRDVLREIKIRDHAEMNSSAQ